MPSLKVFQLHRSSPVKFDFKSFKSSGENKSRFKVQTTPTVLPNQ